MDFDPKPSTWFGAGFTLAGHVVGLTTNDASSNKLLTKLTDALADPTTGDIRAVLYAICEMAQAKYDAIDPANLPQRMALSAATNTGRDSKIRRTFTLRFDLDATTTPVAAEPA